MCLPGNLVLNDTFATKKCLLSRKEEEKVEVVGTLMECWEFSRSSLRSFIWTKEPFLVFP